MSLNRGTRGFTLLEVVAAMMLLGVGLAILYTGYMQAANLEAKAAETGTAYILARAKLAQAEAGEETGAAGRCEGAPGFAWKLERAPLPGTGLARLSATVSWQDARERSVTVWTLVNDGT
ncbi:MAG: type IV pilus modification PilV family protein [Patescibacteria group bacterium]